MALSKYVIINVFVSVHEKRCGRVPKKEVRQGAGLRWGWEMGVDGLRVLDARMR